MTWFKGSTDHGRTVVISADPYPPRNTATIEVDGELVRLAPADGRPPYTAVTRLRDGGTTRIHTERGVIVIPTPFQWGKLPGGEWTSPAARERAVKWPTLDGARLRDTSGVIVPSEHQSADEPDLTLVLAALADLESRQVELFRAQTEITKATAAVAKAVNKYAESRRKS